MGRIWWQIGKNQGNKSAESVRINEIKTLYSAPASTIIMGLKNRRLIATHMQDTLALRPRTSGRFNSLMELYENNYMLIRLLAPGLKTYEQSRYVSRPDGLLPLELSNIEHNRYTTTFKLTYLFSSTSRLAREPDLAIRLYHDARTCEVMSGLIPASKTESRRTRDLDDGYRLNRFLHKWVSYCLRQGHGFELGSTQQQSAGAEVNQEIVVP